MNEGKFLALDYGDRRVGMAISDFDHQIAFPRDFFEYKKTEDLVNFLKTFCEAEQIIKIILGLPIHMDGRLGDRAKKTQQFHIELQKALPALEIVFFDERLSTQFAVQSLRGQGIRAKDQKGKRDVMSAQIILQNYLASKK